MTEADFSAGGTSSKEMKVLGKIEKHTIAYAVLEKLNGIFKHKNYAMLLNKKNPMGIKVLHLTA